jgi:hypothetical protein
MITIQIGSSRKSIEEHYESWIIQQIINRRKDGVLACVKVFIEVGSVNLVLTTPDYTKSRVSRRLPNPQEKDLIDLWDKKGLNEKDFTPGNIIAFLKQIRGTL